MNWVGVFAENRAINQSLVGGCRTLEQCLRSSAVKDDGGMSATEFLLSSSLDDFPSSPNDLPLLINYPPRNQQGTKNGYLRFNLRPLVSPDYLRRSKQRGRKLPDCCMRIGKMQQPSYAVGSRQTPSSMPPSLKRSRRTSNCCVPAACAAPTPSQP